MPVTKYQDFVYQREGKYIKEINAPSGHGHTKTVTLFWTEDINEALRLVDVERMQYVGIMVLAARYRLAVIPVDVLVNPVITRADISPAG